MTILSNNLKRIFGKKLNIICMIIIPIVLNILIISVSTREIKYNIGILDNDSTQYTQDFITRLEKTCNVKMLNKNDDIKSMVINRDVDCAFSFETGFTNEMILGNDVSVKTYAMEGTNSMEPIEMYVSSYISASKEIAKASNTDAESFYKGMNNYNKNEYAVEYKNFASNSTEGVSTAVTSLGFIAFGMVFLMSFSTMLILEDKISGVYDRIATTPLKRSQYFIQHLISYFTVAVIQVVAVINILPKIINVSYGDTTVVNEVMLICCIFALVCISIGIVVSRFSKNTLMAGSITTLINLPMLMLGGCLWPREVMPENLQRVSDFMPTRWFLKAAETVLYGDGIMKAMNEILYMLALVAFMLILSFVIKTEKAR